MSKTNQEKINDEFLQSNFGLTTEQFKNEIRINGLNDLSESPKNNITLQVNGKGETYTATYSEPQLKEMLKENGVSF